MALTKAHNRMIDGASFNVKDYGATGDNSTDDTSAIQAAIDAAELVGGTVFFPQGEYVTSSKLTIDGAISVVGNSKNNNCVIKPNGNFTVIETTSTAQGLIIEGISINADENNTSEPMVILGTRYCTVRDCWFVGSAFDAIQVSTASHSVFFVKIENCRITGGTTAKSAGGDGITTEDNSNNTTIFMNENYIGSFRYGIKSTYNIVGGGANNIIEGCTDALLIGNRDQTWVNTYFEANSNDFYVLDAGAYILGCTGSATFTYQSSTAKDNSTILIDGDIFTENVRAKNVLIADLGTTQLANAGGLQVSTVGVDSVAGTFRRDSATSSGAEFYFSKSRGTTADAKTAVVNNDSLGGLYWQGADGTNDLNAAMIRGEVDATVASTKVAGRLSFYTATDATPSVLTSVLDLDSSGNLLPASDGTQTLGGASNRWSEVFASTGTINTSDEREKEQIRDLTTAETNVATTVKGLVKAFKYRSAVEAKGANARTHIGVIAQDVKAAFEAEGLNAFDYGILCYDTWDEQPERVDEDGNVLRASIPAGDRYGVRYEELLAFIISTL